MTGSAVMIPSPFLITCVLFFLEVLFLLGGIVVRIYIGYGNHSDDMEEAYIKRRLWKMYFATLDKMILATGGVMLIMLLLWAIRLQ